MKTYCEWCGKIICTNGKNTVHVNQYYFCCEDHLSKSQEAFRGKMDIKQAKWELQSDDFKRKWLAKIKPMVTVKQFKTINKIKINRWLNKMNSIVKPILKGVIHNRERAYLGHCLHPDHENFNANIGSQNWIYCPKCKIKWCFGEGNFSDPPDYTKEELVELWLSNKKELEEYEDVTDNELFLYPEDKKEREMWFREFD